MIERAYLTAASLGLDLWNEDEAGPFQTTPYAGSSWQPETRAKEYDHEYVRNGTAKMLTLFNPATGLVRVKGVLTTTNEVLHGWLKAELSNIAPDQSDEEVKYDTVLNDALWHSWQEDLEFPITLPKELPRLRVLLIMDNLAGHHSRDFVLWMFEHGIMPLYTPVGGSWLNMAESIQGILKRRALAGTHPATPQEIIEWLEQTAGGWNKHPTPFEWGGRRAARRQRSYERRHRLAGSAAFTRHALRRRPGGQLKLRKLCQTTH